MTRPDHFFVSDDGALCDTRSVAWAQGIGDVLRENYRRHHRKIETVADLKATLRAGCHTSLGGYPLFFITHDGEALSFEAVEQCFRQVCEAIRAQDNLGGWRVVACEVNYEDGNLTCAHTEKRIPSAYAED